MGQCTALADRHSGGGSRRRILATRRLPASLRARYSGKVTSARVRSPLDMATGSSTVHVNNMEINRGKMQTTSATMGAGGQRSMLQHDGRLLPIYHDMLRCRFASTMEPLIDEPCVLIKSSATF